MGQQQDALTTQSGMERIPVGPPEFEVPVEDPFANDLLMNHVRAQALTNLIQRARPPYVIAVDAGWGNGKTTFLRMLKQELQNEGFGVIAFNAWEHDFTDNPVTTLAGEIVKQTKSFGQKSLRRRATELAKAVAPIAIEIGAGTIPAAATGNVPGAAANSIKGALKLLRILGQNDPVAKYAQTTNGICNFKKALRETATEVACQHDGKPMIVAIDELDRCRPDFALRFLEIVKHFFSTPHTVFVITTNLDQMAQTVRAVYGQNFNAEEYLDRFFDLPCKLTHINKDAFISDRLRDIQRHWIGLETISPGENVFGSLPKPHQSMPEDMTTATQLLKAYCEKSQISLRRIDKIANRIRLILDLLEYTHSEAVVAITIVSIIRDGDPGTYQRILDGSATEEDLVYAMQKTAGELDAIQWRDIAEGTALGLAHVLPANDLRMGPHIAQRAGGNERSENLRSTINSSEASQADRESADRIIRRVDRIIELESQSQLTISDAITTAELITPWTAPD